MAAHLPGFTPGAASCRLKLRWAHLLVASYLDVEVGAALTQLQYPIQLLADDIDLPWGLMVAPQDEARCPLGHLYLLHSKQHMMKHCLDLFSYNYNYNQKYRYYIFYDINNDIYVTGYEICNVYIMHYIYI